MTTRRIFAILLALTTLGILASQVKATSYHHLDELALRMQRQSRALASEFSETLPPFAGLQAFAQRCKFARSSGSARS